MRSSDEVQQLVINLIKENIPLEGGYLKDTMKVSGNKIFIYTPKGVIRVVYMQQIKNYFEKERDLKVVEQDTQESSIGRLVIYDQMVYVKPKGRQGVQSAGIENELILVNSIKNYSDDGLIDEVIFESINGKIYRIKNVKDAIEVGRDTAGFKKSDVNLVDSRDRVYGLSLKMDNAERWSSMDANIEAMTNAKEMVEKAVMRNLITIQSQNPTVPRIATKNNRGMEFVKIKDQKNISFYPKPKVAESAVFGNDKPVVIVKTFKPVDFRMDNGVLHIKVSKIYKNINEVNQDAKARPIWVVTNAKDRNANGFYPGLRAQLFTEARARSTIRIS